MGMDVLWWALSITPTTTTTTTIDEGSSSSSSQPSITIRIAALLL